MYARARQGEIRLFRSKAAQERPEDVILPAADMPLALEWLNHWGKIRGRKAGELVFQQLSRSGRPLPLPMAPEAIAKMVRRRVHEHLLATGVDAAEALALAEEYSGHSLRSGVATEASDAGASARRGSGRTAGTGRRPRRRGTSASATIGKTAH